METTPHGVSGSNATDGSTDMRYLLLLACLIASPASAQMPGGTYAAARIVLDEAADDAGHGIAVIRVGVQHALGVLDDSGISLDPLEMQTFLSQQTEARAFLADVEARFGAWFRTAGSPPQTIADAAELTNLSDADLAERLLGLPERLPDR